MATTEDQYPATIVAKGATKPRIVQLQSPATNADNKATEPHNVKEKERQSREVLVVA